MKSLLLLALGLARTVVLGARIEAERIVVSVRPYKREQRRCPVCGRACGFYDMASRGAPRLWGAMDLARSACYLEYAPCRVRCPEHGVRTEAVPWARHGLATLMWTVPGGAQETGGPYMRDPRHPRHFTDEFKRQIVDLYNAGKPKREIMDEYDLGKSTVERWIKSINATGSPRAACNRTPEQNRILELERENRRLRMEVDVLKQAALIYARK